MAKQGCASNSSSCASGASIKMNSTELLGQGFGRIDSFEVRGAARSLPPDVNEWNQVMAVASQVLDCARCHQRWRVRSSDMSSRRIAVDKQDRGASVDTLDSIA